MVKTLRASLRPRYAVTVSGFCLNENLNTFYPCVGFIASDGTWSYLSAINALEGSNIYYIYHANDSINRLTRFRVWLTGSWATNTNGV